MSKVSHVIWALLAAAMVVASCSDKGIEPKPPQDKDYIVYFCDAGWTPLHNPWASLYYGYHTLTQAVDSFIIPCPDCSWNSHAISPHGDFMYLYDGANILTVDLTTHAIVRRNPVPGMPGRGCTLLLSPDGRTLVIQGIGLFLLSVPDFLPIFSDTVEPFQGVFSDDSRHFYCAAIDSVGMSSYRLDLDSGFTVSKWYLPYGGAYVTVPSKDGEKLFLYDWVGGPLFYFLVYDIEKDSLIFIKELIPGFGHLALTPDGRYLIVTQSNPMGQYMPPPDYFLIYDVDGNRIYKEVCTWCTTEDSIEVHTWMGNICMTPDGEHLINVENDGGQGFFDFNLETMKYECYVKFPSHDKSLAYPMCQTQP